MFLLALSNHLGALRAHAQAGKAMLENGDIYQSNGTCWTFVGNVLGTGGPVSSRNRTLGSLKSQYR
jgi:hypothetical protein